MARTARWFLSVWECVICGDEMMVLHAEGMGREERCEGCGYEMNVTHSQMESHEVPESFAKAEHERFDIPWEWNDEK